MKHELPIAIGLLAIGCLPWFWQGRESSELTAAVEPPISAPIPAPTTFQDIASPAVSSATFAQASISSDSSASRDFLKQISNTFRDGEPRFGDLEIENYLLGSTQVLHGRFWCHGKGSSKSRLELIPDSKAAMKVTQVCDGRFLYRLTESHDKKKLNFYSLDKLNNDDAGIIESTLPATWVGGSVSDLFSNLADAFRFGDMKTATDNQYVEVVGTWKPKYLAKLMVNWVDHREILPEINWEKLPSHLPHGTRMRFTNNAGQWQPNEVTFFRFDAKSGNQPTPALVIRFGMIHQQAVSEDLFRIDSDASDATDETELYNGRIDILTGKQRVADEASGTIR